MKLTCAMVAALTLTCAARAGEIVVLDQIGPDGAFLGLAASSSQFPPGDPQAVFATVDNFVVPAGDPVYVTQIQAVVAQLQNVVGFNLVQSWNVEIYSSLDAATTDFFGDVLSLSLETPSAITSGFGAPLGFVSEIATFDVDVLLDPGEYWMTVAMENDAGANGIVGIHGSVVGDGPARFAVPSQGSSFALSLAAAYRVTGAAVPAPGALGMLATAALIAPRRRRSHG